MKTKKIIGWKSTAWWPNTVYLGSPENTSDDKHHTEQSADSVCSFLRRNGLGGDRKVFPLKTEVTPIYENEP